jgi:AcrR family transcriptional regulator
VTVAKKRRQREREERRAAIVAAAEEVFIAKGFEAATMDQVAACAELSKGTLYLYFKSKDELFLAMSVGTLNKLISALDDTAARDLPGIELLHSMFSAYAAIGSDNPRHFRVAIGWLTSPAPVDTGTEAFNAHQACTGKILGRFVEAITRGQQDNSIRNDTTPLALASQLWGGMLGTVLLRNNAEELARRMPKPVDFAELVPGYLDILCNGLRPRDD